MVWSIIREMNGFVVALSYGRSSGQSTNGGSGGSGTVASNPERLLYEGVTVEAAR